MIAARKRTYDLYVDNICPHWIVLDPDGNYWMVPGVEQNAWELREPYYPTPETELVSVPGHYKCMLGLPLAEKGTT